MISPLNEVELESYRKLARFQCSLYDYKSGISTEKVLEQPGDINYQLPANPLLKARKSDLIGSTALHLVQTWRNEKIFKSMIQNGADFTIKNAKGLTVLHQSIQSIYDNFKDDWRHGWFQAKFDDEFAIEFVEAVLTAHVETKNPNNPCNNDGISHYHIACMVDHSKAVEFFLNNGISVNQAVNEDSPILSGYTPLHIAGICGCLEAAKVLLKYGADTTVKNAKGMTPLQSIVSRNMEIIDWMHTRDAVIFCFKQLRSRISDNEEIIKLMLSDNAVDANVVDDVGFSFFHAACTLKDTSIAEKLLEQNVDINHFVNMVSPVWPGYTALHFAAHFNIETVKLLVNKGVNIEAKDSYGVIPFDICVERFDAEDLHGIISSHAIWKNIKLSDGTKLVDLVYIMRNTEMMSTFFELEKLDVNAFLPVDSPLWPGYSVLHLAVIFTETIDIANNYPTDEDDDDCWVMGSNGQERRSKCHVITEYIKRVEFCLYQGADVTATDAQGFTPLHLAFRLQKFNAVNTMLNYHPDTINPIDKDNLSHLYIACFAQDTDLVESLLSENADVNISLTSTFQWHKNNNCFVYRYRSLGFKNGGSTPLHAAVTNGAEETTKLLLKHGADVNAKDANGLTPLHKIFSHDWNHKIADMLLSCPNLKDSVFNDSLSHLHLASFFGNLSAVERLLDSGANINATINVTSKSIFKDYHKWSYQPLAFLLEYSGCTPLHIAMGLHTHGEIHMPRRTMNIAKLLLQRGADIFIRNSVGHCVAYMSLNMRYLQRRNDIEITFVENDVTLQKRMFKDSGITMLHIACWKVDVELVKKYLSQGADVNAQAHEDSPIWPGWTPMHVLMLMAANRKIDSDRIDSVMHVLLDYGADLTLVNAEFDTPLHLSEPGKLACEIVSYVSYRSYADSPYAGLLLEKLKDRNVNLTNIAGISHFHIASLRNNVEIVRTFLQHGVQVNKQIDFFSDRYSGCTPLHLALNPETSFDATSRGETIKLLLKYGADVKVQDFYGNTPLHLAVKRGFPGEDFLKPILSAGADLNAINLRGETVLEVLLKSGNLKMEDIKYFLLHGYHMNSYNPFSNEGFFGIISKYPLGKEIIMTEETVLEIDNTGRTAIHNVVSLKNSPVENYPDLIGALIKRGCDVDRQDNQGGTALHVAVRFLNVKAVLALLLLGADINAPDSGGKTAFARSVEYYNMYIQYSGNIYSQMIKGFAMHVHKMQLCGLCVHELNAKTLTDIPRYVKADEDDISKFDEEIRRAKNVKIASSHLTVYDYLSDSRAWESYMDMSDSERGAIDRFFESINMKHEFPEFISILRLRYRTSTGNKARVFAE